MSGDHSRSRDGTHSDGDPSTGPGAVKEGVVTEEWDEILQKNREESRDLLYKY